MFNSLYIGFILLKAKYKHLSTALSLIYFILKFFYFTFLLLFHYYCSKRAFEGLLQLLHLNLSRNSLKIIPNEAFIGLPSLRKLDLSFNRISKLDNKTNGIFDDLLSLSELHLQHNRISFVTRKSFPEHQYIPYNLLYLDLSHNLMPVLTYDLTFGTKRLKTLNVSNNQINDLRRGKSRLSTFNLDNRKQTIHRVLLALFEL